MKIAILDDYQEAVRKLACFDMLKGHDVTVFKESMDEDTMAAALAGFDAIVLIRERTTISKSLLERLPALKLISQTGKVSGHVDVDAATKRGVAIVEGVGDPTAPAELTWTLIMAASRRVTQYVENLRKGHWQIASAVPAQNEIGRRLKGSTLGVWGYGKIGRLIAGYGKAFGMNVVIWGREPSRVQAAADGYAVATSKAAFFAEADVLTVHLRLNTATAGVVTADDLASMKPSAIFVNTSRAELVEAGGIEQALRIGRPGQFALDVFEQEPVAAGDLLTCSDQVLATPHLGYVERAGYELYFSAAFQNVVDFAGGEPKNILNLEALR